MDIRDLIGLVCSIAAIAVCLWLALSHDYKSAAVISPMGLAGLGFIGGFTIAKGNGSK